MDSEHGGIWADPEELKRNSGATMLQIGARRCFLFSGVIAKQGQIFGNQTKGSVARVTNGMAFSCG